MLSYMMPIYSGIALIGAIIICCSYIIVKKINQLSESKTELFKLKFSLATNGLDNPLKIREVKRNIARIKTELRQRELNGNK